MVAILLVLILFALCGGARILAGLFVVGFWTVACGLSLLCFYLILSGPR